MEYAGGYQFNKFQFVLNNTHIIFEPHIPSELEEKVYYICNDCKNIWEWSEKVYEFVKRVRIK